MWSYPTAAKWHIHTEFHLEPNEAAVRNSASTNDPHAFFKNQTKHAFLAHEQSFPYVLNDASQKVPFRTQHISPETAVATETHRKIYFIILLKPHKSTALWTKYNQSITYITTWCGHISASNIVLCVRVAMKQIRWEIFLLQFTRRGWLVFVPILISRSSSLGSSSKHENWSREGNAHICDPRVCRSRQIGNYIDCAE